MTLLFSSPNILFVQIATVESIVTAIGDLIRPMLGTKIRDISFRASLFVLIFIAGMPTLTGVCFLSTLINNCKITCNSFLIPFHSNIFSFIERPILDKPFRLELVRVSSSNYRFSWVYNIRLDLWYEFPIPFYIVRKNIVSRIEPFCLDNMRPTFRRPPNPFMRTVVL